METPLDLLMKATHYVENQQQSNNLNNANGPSNSNAVTNEDKPIKENGHAGISIAVCALHRNSI